MDLADVAQDAGDALADLGAHRLALGDRGGLLLEHVGLHHLLAGLRMHGLRPGLNHEQPSRADLDAVAVLGPLDVHGPAVMVLDDAGPARQLEDVVVTEDVDAALLRGGGHVLHRLRSPGVGVVDHLDFLGARPLADDRPLALFQGRLEDVELVRVDRALDHVLAQAPGAGEEDRVLEAGLGVDGEHDARAGGVGTDHLLHHDGQVDVELAEPLVVAVADGPVGEQRGEAALAGVDERLRAADVQVGVLLAGERGVRQILGRGRRAHRHVHLRAVLLLHLAVGAEDGRAQVGRELGGADDVAHLGAARLQVAQVVGVQVGQGVADGRLDPGLLEQVLVGVGGDGVAVGHLHALGGEFLVHFPKGGVLAADHRHVFDPNFVKPENKRFVVFGFHL